MGNRCKLVKINRKSNCLRSHSSTLPRRGLTSSCWCCFGPSPTPPPSNAQRHGATPAADALADEFERLLESAVREEDLQAFLTQHPEVLYPDYVACHPKFRLGNEYVTDYVFVVQGGEGLEHVFVEIERATKPIATKDGQFSSAFTQAKDQLLAWEGWVTRNHAYVREHLPQLFRPTYHLVMGRSHDASPDVRHKLQTDFAGSTRRFSTYDDVLARFRTVLRNLFPSTGA